MFGLVAANSAQLNEEQRRRYGAAYCGLCRTLGERHGQRARLSLTYDLTFLVLLLDSLEEPELRRGEDRCLPHPLKKRPWRRSKWTDYAADMNVALAYHKCLDDWNDEKKRARLAYAKALQGAYDRVKREWPGQCALIEEQLRALGELERQNSADLDGASACFGALMAGLLSAPGGFFEPQLRALGDALGRFIYVMDAVLDQEADARTGSWNPVARFREEHGVFQERPALELLIGEAAAAFERLPLEQDLDLLRNILYSGVWNQWVARERKDRKKQEKQ
jgi:hypothetical protein